MSGKLFAFMTSSWLFLTTRLYWKRRRRPKNFSGNRVQESWKDQNKSHSKRRRRKPNKFWERACRRKLRKNILAWRDLRSASGSRGAWLKGGRISPMPLGRDLSLQETHGVPKLASASVEGNKGDHILGHCKKSWMYSSERCLWEPALSPSVGR